MVGLMSEIWNLIMLVSFFISRKIIATIYSSSVFFWGSQPNITILWMCFLEKWCHTMYCHYLKTDILTVCQKKGWLYEIYMPKFVTKTNFVREYFIITKLKNCIIKVKWALHVPRNIISWCFCWFFSNDVIL